MDLSGDGVGGGLSQIMKAHMKVNMDVSIMGLTWPQSLLLESTVTAYPAPWAIDVAVGRSSFLTRNRRQSEGF